MVFFIFKPAVQTEEKPAEQKQESAGISFITLLKPLALLLFVFFTAQLIGQIPATVWVLFTESRFAGQRGGRFFTGGTRGDACTVSGGGCRGAGKTAE
ncbi:hypothetical protein ECZU26_20440 [Escherichia coli]|nr:hypothetical protein ECZU26_20440 [Escherichia coli]